jgi:hypothetical protein
MNKNDKINTLRSLGFTVTEPDYGGIKVTGPHFKCWWTDSRLETLDIPAIIEEILDEARYTGIDSALGY